MGRQKVGIFSRVVACKFMLSVAEAPPTLDLSLTPSALFMFQEMLYISRRIITSYGTEGWEAQKESIFLKEFSITYGIFSFHSLNVEFFPNFKMFYMQTYTSIHIQTPYLFHNLYNNYYRAKKNSLSF